MPFNKIVKREIEVAFSKDSQPVVFRIVKYVLLSLGLYFFWRSRLFWTIFIILIALSILLHFWYRHKTQGWTRSYGLWKHDKHKQHADRSTGEDLTNDGNK